MLDRFVRLCEIASPTGQEREVADAVLDELREHRVDVAEDGSAVPAEAAAGNLIARVPGTGEGLGLLLRPSGHRSPRSADRGRARRTADSPRAATRSSGADNKAAVTVLMELAARHAADPGSLGLELVFTVAEEDGLRGAKELDISTLRAPFGFVLDHATPIGEVIVAAPTYKRLIAEFTGQEAHAGINPEDGHSAIAAAAAAVAGMKLGRLDEETTANVGIIEGGTASNVVAGHCRILGEARSVDGERAATTIGEMVDACTWAAGEQGCDVDAQVIEMFRGYRLDPKSEAVRVASEALQANRPRAGAGRDGRRQRRERPGGLRLRGRAARQRDRGEPHSARSRLPKRAIVEMLEVCEAAIDEAAKVAVTTNGG